MIEEIRSETETLFERLEKTFGVRLGGTFVALTRAADGKFERAGTFTIVRGDGDAPAQVHPSPATPPPDAGRADALALIGGAGFLPGDPHPDGFPGTDEGSHYMAQSAVQPPPPPAPQGGGYTGNICVTCGNARMKRAGTCETCEVCGNTSGCS